MSDEERKFHVAVAKFQTRLLVQVAYEQSGIKSEVAYHMAMRRVDEFDSLLNHQSGG